MQVRILVLIKISQGGGGQANAKRKQFLIFECLYFAIKNVKFNKKLFEIDAFCPSCKEKPPAYFSMNEMLRCILFVSVCHLGFGLTGNYPRNGESLIEFWPLNDLNSVGGVEFGRGIHNPGNSRLEPGPFSNSAMSANTSGAILRFDANSSDPNFIETFSLSFYFYISAQGFEGDSQVALFNIFDSSLNVRCFVCSFITSTSIKIKYNSSGTEEAVYPAT